jgi:hypothetical protein
MLQIFGTTRFVRYKINGKSSNILMQNYLSTSVFLCDCKIIDLLHETTQMLGISKGDHGKLFSAQFSLKLALVIPCKEHRQHFVL